MSQIGYIAQRYEFEKDLIAYRFFIELNLRN